VTTRSTDSDVPDAKLVAQALAGSQSAYRELVRRFQGPVLNLVAHLARGRADAEDLTQEVFVKAFAALRRYDPARKFSSWLFKIAHNQTIDHLRRTRPDMISVHTSGQADALLTDAASPADLAEQAALAGAMAAALGRLRVEYREALVLRYQEGLSQDEIAEVMGVPDGTVKTYLHRARKELAAEMTARGWGRATDRA